jgi:hypothetical protein
MNPPLSAQGNRLSLDEVDCRHALLFTFRFVGTATLFRFRVVRRNVSHTTLLA